MATAFKGLIILGLFCKAIGWWAGFFLIIWSGFSLFTIVSLLGLLFRPDGELLFFLQQKKSNQKNAATTAGAPIEDMGVPI